MLRSSSSMVVIAILCCYFLSVTHAAIADNLLQFTKSITCPANANPSWASWNTTTSYCDWPLVVCDGDGNLIQVYFMSMAGIMCTVTSPLDLSLLPPAQSLLLMYLSEYSVKPGTYFANGTGVILQNITFPNTQNTPISKIGFHGSTMVQLTVSNVQNIDFTGIQFAFNSLSVFSSTFLDADKSVNSHDIKNVYVLEISGTNIASLNLTNFTTWRLDTLKVTMNKNLTTVYGDPNTTMMISTLDITNNAIGPTLATPKLIRTRNNANKAFNIRVDNNTITSLRITLQEFRFNFDRFSGMYPAGPNVVVSTLAVTPLPNNEGVVIVERTEPTGANLLQFAKDLGSCQGSNWDMASPMCFWKGVQCQQDSNLILTLQMTCKSDIPVNANANFSLIPDSVLSLGLSKMLVTSAMNWTNAPQLLDELDITNSKFTVEQNYSTLPNNMMSVFNFIDNEYPFSWEKLLSTVGGQLRPGIQVDFSGNGFTGNLSTDIFPHSFTAQRNRFGPVLNISSLFSTQGMRVLDVALNNITTVTGANPNGTATPSPTSTGIFYLLNLSYNPIVGSLHLPMFFTRDDFQVFLDVTNVSSNVSTITFLENAVCDKYCNSAQDPKCPLQLSVNQKCRTDNSTLLSHKPELTSLANSECMITYDCNYVPNSSGTGSSSNGISNTAAIAIGVSAGLVGLALILLFIRHRTSHGGNEYEVINSKP